MSADADLSGLRQDSRFAKLLEQAQRNARPCDGPAYRQFDFWIGQWDVHAQGQLAGANSIQPILDGCVLLENWTGARGGSGKSFNFYNAATGKWQQTWVSNTGYVLELAGEFKGEALAYQGETRASNGSRTLHRLTFTKISADRVRQLWEQSQDGGKSWAVVFDGDYLRKK